MNTKDNIAAIATGTAGSINIIRLSGPEVLEIANSVRKGKNKLSAAFKRQLLLGEVGGDQVLAVFMPGPHSYTGDDVVEFQTHGGSVAARAVLDAVLAAGCRTAEPGEFTFRAFVNGKMDLLQAEAVGELISAGSAMAMRIAEKQLDGVLSREIKKLRDGLIDILADCESQLDFSEEDIAFEATLVEQTRQILRQIERLIATGGRGRIIREGISVAIVGAPNVGKSSLLNRILGYDRAIVSDIPGTTRDTLEESAVFGGIRVRFTDTAGLRESCDPVESIGIERSKKTLECAQIIFHVLDASTAALPEHAFPPNTIAVWNKIDLLPSEAQLPTLNVPTVQISVVTGEGMDELADLLAATIWGSDAPIEDGEIAVNARSESLLAEAASLLPEAIMLLEVNSLELAAVNLKSAVTALGKITGETATPDLLEKIFSKFCIGK